MATFSPAPGARPPGPDEPVVLARITAVASGVHGGIREILLVHGTLQAHREDAWDALHDAIRVAVAAGHHLDEVAAVTAPSAGRLAGQRAAGLLMADAAVLAEVEDHVLSRSEELGGEVPVGDSARMRGLVARARRDLDASVRRAVASGLSSADILRIAADAGLALEPTDLVVAFESAA